MAVSVNLSPGKERLSLPSVWRGSQPTTQQIPDEHPADGAPVPSHSSLSHASHCPPGTVGGRPYTCLRSLCHLRTDRSDGWAAGRGLLLPLSREPAQRGRPQAQGPRENPRQRHFELIIWVVRPLARKPMSILAFSLQGHSSHLCVQPATG